MPDHKECCENCYYCVTEETGASRGACHRYPPNPTVQQRGLNSQHTHVYDTGWCGEYQAKDEEPSCDE